MPLPSLTRGQEGISACRNAFLTRQDADSGTRKHILTRQGPVFAYRIAFLIGQEPIFGTRYVFLTEQEMSIENGNEPLYDQELPDLLSNHLRPLQRYQMAAVRYLYQFAGLVNALPFFPNLRSDGI